ncbi:hypothetical protein B0H65DRAFT_459767 [Neurospora tetraspora]|uniref:Uncharacterized protein n=1 Tax=Neurospora tetraspora TaxID=94610 RepID=A0AAE0JMA5_9PEZI|nr:hypothetical protein B0H65DRAFT_459767 [Neurospora tetraspora]
MSASTLGMILFPVQSCDVLQAPVAAPFSYHFQYLHHLYPARSLPPFPFPLATYSQVFHEILPFGNLESPWRSRPSPKILKHPFPFVKHLMVVSMPNTTPIPQSRNSVHGSIHPGRGSLQEKFLFETSEYTSHKPRKGVACHIDIDGCHAFRFPFFLFRFETYSTSFNVLPFGVASSFDFHLSTSRGSITNNLSRNMLPFFVGFGFLVLVARAEWSPGPVTPVPCSRTRSVDGLGRLDGERAC